MLIFKPIIIYRDLEIIFTQNARYYFILPSSILFYFVHTKHVSKKLKYLKLTA